VRKENIKFLIKNHKTIGGNHNNQYHGSYTKIFNILESDSIGLVDVYWEESFEPLVTTNDWILELNEVPESDKLDKILALKNVAEYENNA
jgi:hypothetical protein